MGWKKFLISSPLLFSHFRVYVRKVSVSFLFPIFNFATINIDILVREKMQWKITFAYFLSECFCRVLFKSGKLNFFCSSFLPKKKNTISMKWSVRLFFIFFKFSVFEGNLLILKEERLTDWMSKKTKLCKKNIHKSTKVIYEFFVFPLFSLFFVPLFSPY